jgi:hypothetical protein
MYQVAGDSWVALGDPVGPAARHEELAWSFRELVDRRGGRTVFYQVDSRRLPLYLDLGLTLVKLGEEARVPLADFGLEGAARAPLRHQHRRAERDGASFELVSGAALEPLLPRLREISDAWLDDKSTAEKGFSLGSFSERYLREFPVGVVRSEGHVVAFASLWPAGSREEVSVDLMRFGPDAPRRRDGLSLHRADALGAHRGLSLVQPRHGAALGPRESRARTGLAPRRQLPVSPRRGVLQLRGAAALTSRNSSRRGNRAISPRRRAAPAERAVRRLDADLGGVRELVTK